MIAFAYRILVVAALATPELHAQRAPNQPEPLTLGRTIVAIGDESSGGPTMFGHISGLAFDRQGRLYLLDASDNSVRVFDARGRFVGRAGRSGRGPGDISRPMQLYHDGDSSLYVVDDVNGLVMFRTRATEIVHSRTVVLPFRARAMCMLDRRLYLTGYDNGRTVHSFTSDIEIDESFGRPFPPVRAPGAKDPIDTVAAIIEWANRGTLLMACPRREPRLVTVQGNGPGLRAYRTDGTEVWSSTIGNFHGDMYALAGPGKGTIVWGEDATYAVSMLSDSLALVQAVKRPDSQTRSDRQRERATPAQIRSVLVHVRTGRILGESTRLPVILGASGNRIAAIQIDPFPRVIVREFTVTAR